jgi:hypothetical protein
VNGLFYLVCPEICIELIGGTINETGILLTRFSGACALGFSVILWFAKGVKNVGFQRVVVLGILITLVLSFFIHLQGVITKTINVIGWGFVITDFLISMGLIFVLGKLKPAEEEYW